MKKCLKVEKINNLDLNKNEKDERVDLDDWYWNISTSNKQVSTYNSLKYFGSEETTSMEKEFSILNFISLLIFVKVNKTQKYVWINLLSIILFSKVSKYIIKCKCKKILGYLNWIYEYNVVSAVSLEIGE